MAVVDTSVLVAAFDDEHPRHRAARAALAKQAAVVVHGGILEELTRVMRRAANQAGLDGNQVARAVLATLRASPGYRLAADYDEAATAQRFAENPPLSYVDAWGIEVAHATGQELLTFDRDQERAWKAARR